MRYYINIDVYSNNAVVKKLQGKENMRQQLNRIISDKKKYRNDNFYACNSNFGYCTDLLSGYY